MNYKILQANEYETITEFCNRNGVPMPSPGNTIVAVAEQDGQIIYSHMALYQLHLDNQCRDKDYKGHINMIEVARLIEDALPRPCTLYTYPSYANGVRLAELAGFHKAPFPLMIKELPCR